MSRPLRIEYPGATYHVMSRGVARLPIVRDDKDRAFLLDLLQEYVETGRLIIHAFCLMINHLHLLTQTPKARLKRWMQVILSRYATHFNARWGREGHLFQGRYKALLVDNGEYFRNCSRYIHRNPSELVDSLADYRWSSYPSYLGLDPTFQWVSRDRIRTLFPREGAYQEFVESDEPILDPFEEAVAGTVFGSDDFVRATRSYVLDTEPGCESDVLGLQKLRLWGRRPPVEVVCKTLETVFPEMSVSHQRWLSVYVLREHCWMKNREVAEHFGITASAASQAYGAIRKRLRTERDFGRRVGQLTHHLPPPRF